MSLPRLRVGLRVGLLSAGIGLVAALLPPVAASAAPALSVAVTNGGDPGDPTLLEVGPTLQRIDLAVGLSEAATNVTVTPSGAGLAFAQPSLAFGGQPAGSFPAQLQVRATTPGFHTLTVTVTADGAAPAVITLERLWAPSDSHLPATGSLAGQVWGAQVPTEPGARFVDGSMIWFLDAGTAAVGNVRGGRPRCPAAVGWDDDGPCVSYAYDAATGLLELGPAIGLVRPDSIHLAGAGGDDFEGPFDFFDRAEFTYRLAPVKAGKRLAAAFTAVDRVPRPTKRARVIALRKDGTFSVTSKGRQVRAGRYAIKADGRFVLTQRSTRRQSRTDVETLLAVVGADGRADPRRTGAWLTTFEDEGRTSYTSSGLLQPR